MDARDVIFVMWVISAIVAVGGFFVAAFGFPYVGAPMMVFGGISVVVGLPGLLGV